MLKQLFQCFYDKNFKNNINGINKLLIITAEMIRKKWNVILKIYPAETTDCKKEELVTKKRERRALPLQTDRNPPATLSECKRYFSFAVSAASAS